MEITYNALEEKKKRDSGEEVFYNHVGGRIRDARAELRVCPVCGSDDVVIFADSEKEKFTRMRSHFLRGRCKDCNSFFKSDTLFAVYYLKGDMEHYDKDRGVFSWGSARGRFKKKIYTLWACSAVFVLIGCLVAFGIWGFWDLSSWGVAEKVVALMMLLMFVFIPFALLIYEKRDMGKFGVYVDALNEYLRQLKIQGISVFIEGASEEDNAFLEYWENHKFNYWECDD